MRSLPKAAHGRDRGYCSHYTIEHVLASDLSNPFCTIINSSLALLSAFDILKCFNYSFYGQLNSFLFSTNTQLSLFNQERVNNSNN